MTVKLFQDAGGTIPAVLPGQPVGFIKRTKGSDDAKQATALSKPTYARWPKVGRRNLANINTFGAIEVGRTNSYNSGGIDLGLSRDGIVATVEGKGVLGGIPYLDISYVGTSTAASNIFFNIASNNPFPVVEGETLVSSVYMALLSGSVPTGVIASFLNYNPAPTQSMARFPVITSEFARYSCDSVVGAGKDTYASGGAYVKIPAGQSVDFKIRVGGVQVERGSAPTQLQLAYGLNDITEAGVADLWHLYNDGGDSLNVTLPAGTYGLASIGIDRQIVIGTFVSDGTTPVNILRHERQLDVSYRLGAYSFAEELAIRDAWGRKYA